MDQQLHSNSQSNGPAVTALMGAAAGAVGVWCLDRADWFMWNHEDPDARARTESVRPGGEPPAQAMVTNLEERLGTSLSPRQHGYASSAVHYGIGIGPAAAYALFRDELPIQPGVARGAAYGLGVFLLQDEVLNTVTGLGAKPGEYPWQAHARGLVAHLVYGIATEMTLNFMESVVNRDRGALPAT